MSERKEHLKKVGICGHFDGNKPTSSGQIIKTRIVTEELIRQLGKDQVMTVDSSGGAKAVPRMLKESWNLFKNCENVIFLPAYKGLRVFAPVYTFYNHFCHRKIHYVVIGGWLNRFIDKHDWLADELRRFTGVYVETMNMKKVLEKCGLKNVVVMPNFKNLGILNPEQLSYTVEQPYKLCTFSRVMKEKGIEDAIGAVKTVNEKAGNTIYTLDIYGQIDNDYKNEFEALKNDFPNYVKYKGLVPYNKSVDVLKNYFALLFPTYYHGEGFAGTLIDAMAAGTPVIASDWRFNKEIVKPGLTGVLIKDCNSKKIEEVLIKIADNPNMWNVMKITTLNEARKYKPEVAIKPLMEKL